MRISSTSILTAFLGGQAVLIALLNQRQELAIWLFIPTIFVGLSCIIRYICGGAESIYSTQVIGIFIVTLGLISNIAFFGLYVLNPLQYWPWFLYPFSLLVLLVRLFKKDSGAIKTFAWLFLMVLIVAVIKTLDASLAMQLDQGVKRQSNWGNVVAAASPYIFLVKREIFKQILILVAVTGLLVSLKRSGMIAAGILVCMYFLSLMFSVRISWKQNLSKLVALVVGITLFGYAVVFAVSNKSLVEYIEIALLRMSRASDDGGSGRTDIWLYGIKVFQEGSFFQILFGRGFGWLHNSFNRGGYVVESFHNDAVEFLVGFGIFGGILYALFIMRVLYLGLFSYAAKENRSFAFSISVMFFVYSMLSGVFFYIFFFIPLLVGIGYLEARLAIHNRCKEASRIRFCLAQANI